MIYSGEPRTRRLTLDEIEQMVVKTYTNRARRIVGNESAADIFGFALLTIFPLVRAVEEWRTHGPGQSHCDEEGCRCTEQRLREAVDSMRASLKGPNV